MRSRKLIEYLYPKREIPVKRRRVIVTMKELQHPEGVKFCIIDKEGGTLLETWGLWYKE